MSHSPAERTHRVLLPKPDSDEPSSARGDPSPASQSSPQVARNNPVTSLACNACRTKKIKCDGMKPICSVCARRRQPCVYRDVQEKDSAREISELRNTTHGLNRILNYLRDAPEDAATAVFMNLRSGKASFTHLATSLESNASFIDSRFLLNSGGCQKETASLSFRLELNGYYPNAFPALAPLEIADLDLQLLDVNSTTTIDTTSRKRRYSSRNRPAATPTTPNQVLPIQPLTSRDTIVIDGRLDHIDFQRWTSVDITNVLAASAISFYLENEHPILAVFNADLVIDDLVRGSGSFCSPLLLSSILAWSFAGLAQSNLTARQLSIEFLAEAKCRWEGRRRDDLDTVSAAILMTLTCNHHGNDRDGLLYLDASAEIGRRLQLFNHEVYPVSSVSDRDEHHKAAASFVAWGAFTWNTLQSLHFRRRHRLRTPPALPIPGMVDEGGPVLSNYMGSTFTSIAKLCLIVHELWSNGYHEYVDPTLQTAELAYQKLLAWCGELGSATCRVESSYSHHVLVVHIWYHTAIMDVWRPFIQIEPQKKMQHFNSEDSWPRAAYRESVRQLKRLMYVYRHKFETTNPTMLVSPGYLYLVNEIFRDSDAPEAQFYFVLCMCGCLSMAHWCRCLCGITKAFFGLGWQTGLLKRPSWNIGRLKSMREAAAAIDVGLSFNSVYPIDLERALEDTTAGCMEALASEFQKLACDNVSDKESDESDDNIVTQRMKYWTGDPRSLDLTLSEATEH
ncbi:hypothetical protein TruAng_007990 [Truncatella angustata]|nr:hypothetical protein TruAng_007990 [Truncatella angustata]